MRAFLLGLLLLFTLVRPGLADPRDHRPLARSADPDLRGIGVRTGLTLLPWARCQRDVLTGAQQIATGGTFNQERQEHYPLSRRYFAITPGYVYWKPSAPPGGLAITTAADLKKYRVCGMTGHNYTALGLRPDKIDVGPGG